MGNPCTETPASPPQPDKSLIVSQYDDTEAEFYEESTSETIGGRNIKYVLSRKDGITYRFGIKGELLAIDDRYNNRIRFKYIERNI
jgi:hypothetical protein